MIARKLIVAAMFAALSGGAAYAQATQPAAKPATSAPAPAAKPPASAPAAKATAPAAAPAAKPAAAAPAPAAKPAAAVAKKVNLNTATAQELDGLPQIGPARSKAIMDARAKGKFKNWDDFVARKVVPSNAQTAIKDLVAF